MSIGVLHYWVDSEVGCGGVAIRIDENPLGPDYNVIATVQREGTAPIFGVFVGQPFENLANWRKVKAVQFLVPPEGVDWSTTA